MVRDFTVPDTKWKSQKTITDAMRDLVKIELIMRYVSAAPGMRGYAAGVLPPQAG
jgi:hypothetical protein